MLRPSPLTLRLASELYYLPANPGLAPRTRRKLLHGWNCWEKRTSNPPINEITHKTFAAFRAACLKEVLSATTIESTVSDALTVLKACVDAEILPGCPSPGKRLVRRHVLHHTPSVAELSAVLAKCDLAKWPRRVLSAPDWWRAFLAVAYFCGFRRGDLTSLCWTNVREDRLERVQGKTGILTTIPIHPALKPLLARLARRDAVFGRAGSLKQIRGQLKSLCKAAEVAPFTMQGVRRLSSRQWNKARPGCGRLILGRRYPGADGFYLDPFEDLLDAMPRLEVPAAIALKQPHRDERRLLIAFRRLDGCTARQAVKMVEALLD
jgi:integrase